MQGATNPNYGRSDRGFTFCASLRPLCCHTTSSLFLFYLLAMKLPALCSELVDLRLCNVSPLLGFLQFVLDLAEFGEVDIGQLLLCGERALVVKSPGQGFHSSCVWALRGSGDYAEKAQTSCLLPTTADPEPSQRLHHPPLLRTSL